MHDLVGIRGGCDAGSLQCGSSAGLHRAELLRVDVSQEHMVHMHACMHRDVVEVVPGPPAICMDVPTGGTACTVLCSTQHTRGRELCTSTALLTASGHRVGSDVTNNSFIDLIFRSGGQKLWMMLQNCCAVRCVWGGGAGGGLSCWRRAECRHVRLRAATRRSVQKAAESNGKTAPCAASGYIRGAVPMHIHSGTHARQRAAARV